MQPAQPVAATPSSASAPAGTQSSVPVATDSRPVEVVQPVPEVRALMPQGRDLQQTLADVAEHLRKYLRSSARDLEFQVDLDSRRTVIVVRDAAGKVIRQIPGEEAVRIQQRLNVGSGTFLDLFV